MERALNKYVGITCIGGVCYQGLLSAIDPHSQNITLQSVVQDGIPQRGTVNLSAQEIEDILYLTPPASAVLQRPAAQVQRAGARAEKRHPARQRSNSFSGEDRKTHRATPRKEVNHQQRGAAAGWKKAMAAGTFDDPVSSFSGDFDFEHNLSLFDKKRVFEEIEGGDGSTAPRVAGSKVRGGNDVKSTGQRGTAGNKSLAAGGGNGDATVVAPRKASEKQRALKVNVQGVKVTGTQQENDPNNKSSKVTALNSKIHQQGSKGGQSSGQRSDSKRTPSKYRHDEMVIPGAPSPGTAAVGGPESIEIPAGYAGEARFTTDTGLVVPSITLELRERLFTAAVRHGLTEGRLVDAVGRSATEMVLQLLGGCTRITPKNLHQSPRVVALCGPHLQGALGMNCARQLTNHGVAVTLVTPDPSYKLRPLVAGELSLFGMSGDLVVSDTEGIPNAPVDLIVNCLEGQDYDHVTNVEWYRSCVQWANECNAPILAIDPPAESSAVSCDWVLALALPLSREEGEKVYLCDLGIPRGVFNELLPAYTSPFGAKFCVPLYHV